MPFIYTYNKLHHKTLIIFFSWPPWLHFFDTRHPFSRQHSHFTETLWYQLYILLIMNHLKDRRNKKEVCRKATHKYFRDSQLLTRGFWNGKERFRTTAACHFLAAGSWKTGPLTQQSRSKEQTAKHTTKRWLAMTAVAACHF